MVRSLARRSCDEGLRPERGGRRRQLVEGTGTIAGSLSGEFQWLEVIHRPRAPWSWGRPTSTASALPWTGEPMRASRWTATSRYPDDVARLLELRGR
jgi:hypothetical protein